MNLLGIGPGLLVGWLLNWASDFLPRFSRSRSPSGGGVSGKKACRNRPALWLMLTLPRHARRDEPWFILRLSVEGLSALFFALLWGESGPSWNLVLLGGGYAFFTLIALIDLKYRLVLNQVTYPAMAVALLWHGLFSQSAFLNIIVGGVMAFAIFFLAAWLRPGELGGGDIKLAALLGLIFGFPDVLWALIVGAGTGGLVAVALLLARRQEGKMYIPYAPFLCLGAVVTLLCRPPFLW